MIAFKIVKGDIKGSRIVSFKGLYDRREDGWCCDGFIGPGIYVIGDCGIKTKFVSDPDGFPRLYSVLPPSKEHQARQIYWCVVEGGVIRGRILWCPSDEWIGEVVWVRVDGQAIENGQDGYGAI